MGNSKKSLVFKSVIDVISLQHDMVFQMNQVATEMRDLLMSEGDLRSLCKLRFRKTVYDSIFQESLNFTEFLNQSFTYLVCLCAGRIVLEKFANKEVLINFGTQSGFDVSSTDGNVICECFAASTVRSNQKLKKDIERVHKQEQAQHKIVVFYTENGAADDSYIANLKDTFPDVFIVSLSLKQMIGEDILYQK